MKQASLRFLDVRAAGSGIILTAAILASPGHAQDRQAPADATVSQPAATNSSSTLEEIVVTAERRTGDLQRTAASISVRQGDMMVQQGKFTVAELLENVPGVSTVAPSSAAASGSDTPSTEINIRSIATNTTSSGGSVPAVPATAIYTDDIYSGIGSNYDVDRIEVLRGPQGTLYGRSATAGVVAIHTRSPDLDRFSAYGNAEIGNYDLRHLTLALGAPVVEDKVGVRVAFNQYQRDGYYANTAGAINTTEGRIKLLVKPVEGFSLEVGAAIQDNMVQTGGVEIRLTGPDHYTLLPNNNVGNGKNRFEQYWVRTNADVGFGQITYIGALRTWKQDATNIQIGPGGNFLDQRLIVPKDNFLTQELRLSSNPGSHVNWQTGVFYYDNNLTAISDIHFSESGALVDSNETHRQTNDIGVFVEATAPIFEGLRLTGGIRYDRTRVRSSQTDVLNVNLGAGSGATAGLPEIPVTTTISGDQGLSVFNNVTYKARAEYDLTPRNLLYASVSSGFLPGDVQITNATVSRFASETLTAYEVGSKNRFFGNKLQINVSGYYYDYGGYQAIIYQNPSNSASAKIFSLPLYVWGAEFEAIYAITRNDRIGLSGLITDSKIHDAPSDYSDYSVLKSIWGSPKQTLSGFYTHTFEFANGSNVN
ncbi:TonB-dependent receptor, partial [Novosphingobium sp. Rr 2-17]|uniref:TonB-dependent receptor n=1 Tax=Novosphingobium sp. Rr 2-17 TaxID=555793 RepID=UPI00026981EA